jgi:hypothetical protein
MHLDTLFPTEASKNEALEHFKGLKDNPDWLFLVEKLIKADIIDISEKILDPTKEWKPGEEGDAKRQRAYWIILSELPDKLIQALTSKQDDIFTEQDPYFKSTKEIIKSQR